MSFPANGEELARPRRCLLRCAIHTCVLAIGKIATACSCSGFARAPLCQRIDQVKILFIGTAVETNDDHRGLIRGGLWYRFSVEEIFKGVNDNIHELIVDPASGSSCQEEFTIGKRYLVSSFEETLPADALITTGVCSGSRLVEKAADDIAFVRAYATNPSSARVMGIVRSHSDEAFWDDNFPPVAGAAISMIGPLRNFRTRSDQNGRFELLDVPPGKYLLTSAFSGLTADHSQYRIEVPPHGCGIAAVDMYTHGELAGRVLHQNGTPAKRVHVEYRYSDQRYRSAWLPDATTDGRGAFRFRRVPPGDFLLGIHIDSAPEAIERILPTYWPGTKDRNSAKSIHLSPNQKRENLLIRLGPLAAPFKVNIRVRWPDGRPAASASVSATTNGSIAEGGRTDEEGLVRLTLLRGVSYTVGARGWISYRMVRGRQIGNDWVDAEETPLVQSNGPVDITLILTKPEPKR